MRRVAILTRILALAVPAWLASPPARAETLVASLSTHRVAITSNYTGTQLAVFGLVERDQRTVARSSPYDIVVTVRGPRETVLVREKRSLGPFWVNREQRRFVATPSYLLMLSSRPLQEIMDGERARRAGLGLLSVLSPPGAAMNLDPLDAEFRAALVRLKFENGLYREVERGVTFLTPTVFQAPIALPATAPVGNYEVEIVLVAGGSILQKTATNFELVKTGFEQWVADAAHDRRWLYGFGTAALSVFFGWFASVVFRRD